MPTKSTPDEWRNVSGHMIPLASGRPLAPGEKAPCDMEHPADQAHRDEGHLVLAESVEPVDGYDELNAPDAAALLADADEQTAQAIGDYEADNKDRSTVTAASRRRLAELAETDTETEES